MLKMQNDAAKVTKLNSSSAVKVRKSYSADTLLIKSIFEEVSFKNMDLDISKDEFPFILDLDFKKKKKNRIKDSFSHPHLSAFSGQSYAHL